MHKLSCSSLALSKDGRYLLTAGDKVIKVWDYQMRFDINFQVLPTERGKGVAFVVILYPWRREPQMPSVGPGPVSPVPVRPAAEECSPVPTP